VLLLLISRKCLHLHVVTQQVCDSPDCACRWIHRLLKRAAKEEAAAQKAAADRAAADKAAADKAAADKAAAEQAAAAKAEADRVAAEQAAAEKARRRQIEEGEGSTSSRGQKTGHAEGESRQGGC
jgi:membrane protein involved in colicin uptake